MYPGDETPAETDAGIEKQLRDRRYGPPMPYEVTPWDFALRWNNVIVRERVWPVVSRLFDDDDELVRARCIDFVAMWTDGRDVTTPRLVEVAEVHAALYGDQKPEGNITLRYELAHALSNAASGDLKHGKRIAAVLRTMATHEPVAASILARYEPAFVTAQAVKWGSVDPRWVLEAGRSLALFHRDALLSFLNALRDLPEETRVQMFAATEEYTQRDDERAAAIARSYELPPPVSPSPSSDECKRALGL